MTDVIPFGEGQFLIRLFAVAGIPEEIAFDRYYQGVCRISCKDGRRQRRECVVHRPDNRRNVFAMRTGGELALLLRTDLGRIELCRAEIGIAEWGPELSEEAAKARLVQV